jgi:RNA polymerase sigma-70 factor (ECF subfamily)
MSLRDLEGLTAAEVCAKLDLTEGNQRVLLHRARCSIRRALVEYAALDAA